MNNTKRITVFSLSVLMGVSMVTPVFAAENSLSKEEVIYITTEADGGVDNINVVNIFNGGNITDYGEYSSVKMLTTNDEIIQNNDAITFSSNAKKVYYQGTMKEVEIPWNISIRYFMNGKEYTSKEIAGKSGALEIKLSITKNEKSDTSFFDEYALQANLILNMNSCENIKTDGATLANVGSNKQITYTILPGKGINTSIYADVENFEMDAISINGMKLNLNVDIDDEELTAKVKELMSSMQKLNDGALTLSSGSEDLKSGSSSLNDGIITLDSGVNVLDSGITTLQEGMFSLQNGLDKLDNQSNSIIEGSSQMKVALKTIQGKLNSISASTDQINKLTSASSDIKKGISDLNDGIANLKANLGYSQYKSVMKQNGVDIDSLKEGNQKAINELTTTIETLNKTLSQIQNVPGFEEQVTELTAQIKNLQNAIILLKGNNGAITGTEIYLNSVSSAVSELSKGISTLKAKYDEFDIAIHKLANTLEETLINMTELTSGINLLVSEYEKLDKGINVYTDGVAMIVAGYKQMTNGVSSLAAGSKDLLKGSYALSDGSAELYNGIISLCDGANELANGTEKMNKETSNMNEKVQNQVDEILASIKGEETETTSFVSEKNVNVDSVQFVIKTNDIKKAVIVEKEIKKEKISFWEKLLELFR